MKHILLSILLIAATTANATTTMSCHTDWAGHTKCYIDDGFAPHVGL